MKTKLKHIFFLATLSLTAIACGGSAAKPLSGLDVSLLPVSLLSVSPKQAGDEEAVTMKINPEAKDNVAGAAARSAKRSSPRNFPGDHEQSTISNQQ